MNKKTNYQIERKNARVREREKIEKRCYEEEEEEEEEIRKGRKGRDKKTGKKAQPDHTFLMAV